MKYRLALGALIASFFASVPALAIVEARLTYSLLASSPDYSKLYTSGSSAPSAAANAGLGADVLVFIPLTGWGFGIRQENLGITVSGNSVEAKSTANRTAAMASYRFINTLLHLGVNFTYGLSHSNSMEITDGNNKLKWEPDSASSYTAGVEAGVGLGLFVLGGEMGYESLKWNKMKDSTGTSTQTPDIDMTGIYTKVYLGFGF